MLWYHIVPIGILCTVHNPVSATTTAPATNSSPIVDVLFIRNILRSHFEMMTNYTLKTCANKSIAVNLTRMEVQFKECLNSSVMPIMGNTTKADLYQMRRAEVRIRRKFLSLADFVSWKAELARMCPLVPLTLDCYFNASQPQIEGCWNMRHKDWFHYVGNLVWRICDSRESIESLLIDKYIPCFQKYEHVTRYCIQRSTKKFGSPCGVVSCLQKKVGKCGIRKVDKFLKEFFEHFQNVSGCEDKGGYFFRIDLDDPTTTKATTTTTTLPTTTTTTTTTTTLPTTTTTTTTTTKPPTTTTIKVDPCIIFEDKLTSVFHFGKDHLFEFFYQLDIICEHWNGTDCLKKSQWIPILEQCHAPVIFTPRERCMDEAVSTRIAAMERYCKSIDVDVFPDVLPVVGSWCRNHFDIDQPRLNDIFKPCHNDPMPAARTENIVPPLLWGMVVLPVAIFGISLVIHFFSQRKWKAKEPVTPDAESDLSLVSSDGDKTTDV